MCHAVGTGDIAKGVRDGGGIGARLFQAGSEEQRNIFFGLQVLSGVAGVVIVFAILNS